MTILIPLLRLVFGTVLASSLTLNLARARTAAKDDSNTLWYKSPAREWEEALPLGNGRLGAMV